MSCTLAKTTNRKKDQQKQPDDELPSGATFRRPTSVRRTLRYFARYFETMPSDNEDFSAAGVSASESDGDYRGDDDYHGGNEFSAQTRRAQTRQPKQQLSRDGASALAKRPPDKDNMGVEQAVAHDPNPMATFVDMIARAILDAGQTGGTGHSSCQASSSQPNIGVTGLALSLELEVCHVARS